MRKILFLSRYQNTTARGVESFVTELTNHLKDRFEIEIAADRDADSFSKIIKGDYDVVVPMNGRFQGLKASLGRLIKRYKLVVIGQSGLGKDDIFNVGIVRPDFFVGLTDYAIDLTEQEKLLTGKKKLLAKMRKAKSWAWGTKIVKIPNGVDLSTFKPSGNRYSHRLKSPVVLSVGALTWYKHHELTIEAVARLKDVSLLIVGRGEEEQTLRDLAKSKGIVNRFQIISAPYSQLASIYRSADLFTLPSWDREAFGIVYIEAMASGLGVVAPDDPPRREIVGEAGILVDVFDSQKFADAIKQGLEIDWKNKARKQAEMFDWKIISDEYFKLFTGQQNEKET